MEALLPVLVGCLYAAGIFMMLQKNILKLAFGLALLTNATNLFVFISGRMTRAVPPLIPMDAKTPQGEFANPVSEALILTAIVIGFGLLSFLLGLIYIAYNRFNSLDPDDIGAQDE